MVTFALASIIAVSGGVGACKDPNPTFVFDAASDAPKDAAGDSADQGDSGAAGAGGAGGQASGGAGAGGTGGSAGGGGAS